MRRAFSGLVKSVPGSFLKGLYGTRNAGLEVSSTVAMMISFSLREANVISANYLFYRAGRRHQNPAGMNVCLILVEGQFN
jgi:hypothetical protein